MSVPVPGPDEVHVWWIDLNRMVDEPLAVLSPDELARADRFRRPFDRARWTRARAALRQILAGYTGATPKDLRFIQQTSQLPQQHHPPTPVLPSPIAMGLGAEEGQGVRADFRKPALAANSPLRFSLTHAGDRAALAIAWQREVGIDLELIDPHLGLPPLLTVACTSAEISRIETLPPAKRVEAFLAIWTLKEAYLKAMGSGLSREPRAIEIDVLPDGRAMVHDGGLEHDPQRWSLRLLEAGPGWIAALVAAGSEPTISTSAWPIADSR